MHERILIVSQRTRFAADLIDKLRWGRYEPVWSHALDHALDAFSEYDLLIVDLSTARDALVAFITRLRSASDVLILGVGEADQHDLRVSALRAGADGVFAPSIPVDELIARISAHLSRPALRRVGPISIGRLTVEYDARICRVDGSEVQLTRVEFDLLAAFAQRIDVALSRQWLAAHVLHERVKSAQRNLDGHVSHLRRKLGPASAQLKTVRGAGYRLTGSCSPSENGDGGVLVAAPPAGLHRRSTRRRRSPVPLQSARAV